MFTNGAGFFTGLVGSLGYWLAQQAVNRGDQPLYYDALIQIPIYEFLPAIGSLLGILLALMGRKKVSPEIFEREEEHSSTLPVPAIDDIETIDQESLNRD